jgi:uncharacterized protein
MTVREIDTPHGPARAHLRAVEAPVAALVLCHGAAGSVDAPDLSKATEVARSKGVAVALVEQPYRVAGRRSTPPARQLDAAWIAVVKDLRRAELAGLPLIAGGRSAGARVACRTAAELGAVAVLCLAFPLHPPGRSPAAEVRSRAPELDGVAVPTLVVQGTRDRFGMPSPGPNRTVVEVAGDHRLRTDLAAVGDAVGAWLVTIGFG